MPKHCDVVNHDRVSSYQFMSNSPHLKDALIDNYQHVTNVVAQSEISHRPVMKPPEAYVERLTSFKLVL